MGSDQALPRASARAVLLRLLRRALCDDEKCADTIRRALLTADKERLPVDSEELRAFVEAHVAPQLSFDVARVLVDNLAEELRQQGDGKAVSCSSPTQRASPGAADAESGSGGIKLGTVGLTKRSLVDRAVGGASPRAMADHDPARAAAAVRKEIAEGEPADSVVVVDTDRLARASLARALVSAKFDVSVADTISQAMAELSGRGNALIAMGCIQDDGIESTLRSLIKAHPSVTIIAWTDSRPEEAESLLTAAGIRTFGVVSKAASALEVINCIRRVLVSHAATDPPVSGIRSRGLDSALDADRDHGTKRQS